MKLDEFVKETLILISSGIEGAQREAVHSIAPGRVDDEIVEEHQTVSFEVAVTVSKDAGGGISVFSLGDVKVGGSTEHTNRISFEVPIHFNARPNRNQNHDSRKGECGKQGEKE